jgi:phospholipid transport system substrate-binding protein
MEKRKMKKLVVLIILSVLLFAGNVYAEKYSEIKNFVQTMSDKAIDIASDESKTIERRRSELIDLFNERVDLDWVSKFIMGKHWRTASKNQRKKFVELYREYLIKKYAPKFNGYSGKDFQILKIENNYEDEYIVKCKYISDMGEKINVDFLVMQNPKNGELFVNDFIAEGVSFIVMQRSEINSVISNKGLDNFLVDLKARLERTEDAIKKKVK